MQLFLLVEAICLRYWWLQYITISVMICVIRHYIECCLCSLGVKDCCCCYCMDFIKSYFNKETFGNFTHGAEQNNFVIEKTTNQWFREEERYILHAGVCQWQQRPSFLFPLLKTSICCTKCLILDQNKVKFWAMM